MSSSARTPVLQFGTGRFLQAHADLFIHEGGGGPVTVVASSGSPTGKARLAALHAPGGYTVKVRGWRTAPSSTGKSTVTSIARGLDIGAEWREIVRIASHEARFLISNTTESGLCGAGRADRRSRQLRRCAAVLSRAAAGAARRPPEGRRAGHDRAAHRTRRPQRRFAEGDRHRVGQGERRFRCAAGLSVAGLHLRQFARRPHRLGAAGAGRAVAEPYGLWAVEMQPGLSCPSSIPPSASSPISSPMSG